MSASKYSKSLFTFAYGNNSESMADIIEDVINKFEKSGLDEIMNIDSALDMGIIEFINIPKIGQREVKNINWIGNLDT